MRVELDKLWEIRARKRLGQSKEAKRGGVKKKLDRFKIKDIIPDVQYFFLSHIILPFRMKSSRSEQTNRKIINAALRLFVRKGYHGTSISEIANVTKLTKGAIYFHFKNKDALLSRILEEYERSYVSKMIEQVGSADGNALDKMKHLLRFSFNFAAKNRELCICLTNLSTELYSSSKKYQKGIRKPYEELYGLFTKLLEEGVKDGSFREDIAPPLVAMNIVGANDGNLLQWSLNMSQYNGKNFSRSYMKFLLHAIQRHD